MTLQKEFIKRFGTAREPIKIFASPGRVNLIGEHIDYNGGMVFPAGLDISMKMAIRKRTDNVLSFKSLDFDEDVKVSLNETIEYKRDYKWVNYLLGVLKEMMEGGCLIDKGFDVLFTSNIPTGAGLSSSAALEVAFAYGISDLYAFPMDKIQIATLCQRAENRFVGVQCGIMDQFAVAMAKKDHAIMLNCHTLDYQYVPLLLGDYKIVITNTNKKRELVDSKYNQRLKECQYGLERIQKYMDIPNLCSMTSKHLDGYMQYIDDPIVQRRVRHVVNENERVKHAAEALKKNDLMQFGALMVSSHISLRDDYEVTGFELDTLFEEASKIEGCIGTRMTGAGFGGCNVSLVHKAQLKDFQQRVYEKYTERTQLEPLFYTCEAGEGVRQTE
ncbi:galactokinase [Clostridiaceae bacterium 35-E11]